MLTHLTDSHVNELKLLETTLTSSRTKIMEMFKFLCHKLKIGQGRDPQVQILDLILHQAFGQLDQRIEIE